MKQLIILFLFVLEFAIPGVAIPTGKPEGGDETKATLTLNLNFQKQDSVSILNVASVLETLLKNSPENSQFSFKIDKSGVPQKEVVQNSVKINNAFHYSFWKKRDKTFAIGYENYFEINDYKLFKEQILDSLESVGIDLVLFINGMSFPETKISMRDENKKTISFFWSRNDSVSKSFSRFYTSQWFCNIHQPKVGFGFKNPQTNKWEQLSEFPINKIAVVKFYAIGLVTGLIVVLLFVFWIFGIKRNLLRSGPNNDSPYSLSETQMAFWTIIIFSSYLYLLFINHELADLPKSTLILLGISTLTTAGSKGISLVKRGTNPNEKYHVKPSAIGKGSLISFLTDLVSEGNSGISIHRVQMMLFTTLFGVYYLFQVFKQQIIPDFTEEQLWLVGLSSGAFVTIKSFMDKSSKPENDKNKPSTDSENVPAELNDAKTKKDETADKTSDSNLFRG